MFEEAVIFNSALDSWRAGAATTMRRMFKSAILFNQNLSNWDTRAVRDMSFMFQRMGRWTSPSLAFWNVSRVTTFESMFAGAEK